MDQHGNWITNYSITPSFILPIGSERLNVLEMRQVLRSFMESCPNMYTMCVIFLRIFEFFVYFFSSWVTPNIVLHLLLHFSFLYQSMLNNGLFLYVISLSLKGVVFSTIQKWLRIFVIVTGWVSSLYKNPSLLGIKHLVWFTTVYFWQTNKVQQ